MDQKSKTSIQSELQLQASILGNYLSSETEYEKAMNAVGKLNNLIVEDEKLTNESEVQAERLKLEEKKIKDSKSVAKAQLKLEEEKFEYQKTQDAAKMQLEETKLEIEMKNIELNQRKLESDIRIAEMNYKKDIASERNRLIITMVGALGGLLIQGFAIFVQVSIANKSLALEYCDNGITPKKTAEAYREVCSFIKKH